MTAQPGDPAPHQEQTDAHPYAGLTPDRVLDALERLGLSCDGRLLPLNSYENRVYQVGLEDALPVVVKFYRPQRWSEAALREEHGFLAELVEAEIPVVAPSLLAGDSLHFDGEFWYAVFERRGGRAPELDDEATLTWMGRFLGRIHAVGARSRFRHRGAIDPASFGHDSRNWLLAHDIVPAALRDSWASASALALEAVARCFERARGWNSIRLHGDCHAGNVLWTDAGPHFVDFDDSRNGPAVQDLWMLLSGDRARMQLQLNALLDGYRAFRDFDPIELHLMEALRTLRLIHYSAWLARRWDDPAFPAAFPWFESVRYWQDRILELREQIALMDEECLRAD